MAPESDWLVHVDAERLSQAEALRPVFDALAASTWGASLSDMGIDARMDLTGITMFGTITRGPETKGETTTMLQGGAALRDAIQNHVKAHNGYTLVLRRGFKGDAKGVSAWTIDSLSVHVALVPMGVPDVNEGEQKLVAILSDNSNRLQACIAQLQGERRPPDDVEPKPEPGEGGKACHQFPSQPEGSVIFACAKDLDRAHPAPKSELLAAASSMMGHLGYRTQDGQLVVFAGLEIEGGEEADAEQMSESLDRMVEFWTNRTAEIAQRNPAMHEMLPLLRGCQISFTGQKVVLTMEKALAKADEPADRPPLTQLPAGSGPGDIPPKDR